MLGFWSPETSSHPWPGHVLLGISSPLPPVKNALFLIFAWVSLLYIRPALEFPGVLANAAAKATDCTLCTVLSRLLSCWTQPSELRLEWRWTSALTAHEVQAGLSAGHRTVHNWAQVCAITHCESRALTVHQCSKEPLRLLHCHSQGRGTLYSPKQFTQIVSG